MYYLLIWNIKFREKAETEVSLGGMGISNQITPGSNEREPGGLDSSRLKVSH
jgi:hypothetical protein